MKSLRICIGSNDGVRMAETHLGDSGRFLIYDLFEDQSTRQVEERQNTATHLGHGGAEKMARVLQLLDDVDVVVAQKNSPNLRKIAAHAVHKPVVVKTPAIELVLATLGRSFFELHEQVAHRRSGARTQSIPELSPLPDSTAGG